MAHTYTDLLAHLVFSTQNRLPLLTGDLGQEMFPYLGGIVREVGGSAMMIGGTTDHVHALVRVPSRLAVADLMRVLKTNSSGWARKRFRDPFAWQGGYGAFSVSRSDAEEVRAYVAHQREHHRVVGFNEELMGLLKAHHIGYDPEHLWDD